jgi:hypothetical protein
MAVLLGTTVGGLIIIYLLSSLLEWAIMKRVLDSPTQGIPASVAVAVVLAIILYGFGNADGGTWNPLPGGIGYIVAGIMIWLARLFAWRRREAQASEGVAQTFE